MQQYHNYLHMIESHHLPLCDHLDHVFLKNQCVAYNTEPSIHEDASYQVSVHMAKQFQSRSFLEIDQSETRIACGGHVCSPIGTK
jgi:hypothetical protein